ncbi:MAG: anion transporter [Candidatus Muproteobacteria bacterium RBG_16_65_31]|uniref:Anion transporter n=1 Tax=Candidatus Muproteobacteria bacterium RBG_16_65_31 TaxID=1817759 RepID=A0A1F6TEX9_9PROT|nr:MAG: anion transporter [Candidatus Muproteobacteria bacterium RBG_16_65_31]
MPVAVVILAVVLLLIAVRGVGRVRLPIWLVMLLGAAAALLAGAIGPMQAARAINPDVMLFLFGVFVVGQALEESGYLFHLSYKLFRRARSADALILLILFGAGAASAFLMNDTLAIIGTPLMLLLARQHRMPPQVLLLALAFAVTLGSVASPIGNPQNLLIALHGGLANPFGEFFRHLAAPTLLSLLLAFGLLRLFYHESFHGAALVHVRAQLRDRALARLARLALVLLIALTAVKIALTLFGVGSAFRLTYIALIAAAPILLFSPRRWTITGQIDWHTLIFFAAMFVLMESVWNTGFFQGIMGKLGLNLLSVTLVLLTGVLLSQLISNVPLVALLLPLLLHAGASERELLALAAGSTIAGNLFILGAASNVIIIQNAERKGGHTLTFVEFARIGVPLTAVNFLVYWAFLAGF